MSSDPLDPDGEGLASVPLVTVADLRAEVDTKALLRRLSDHGMGRIDMTQTEVAAARIVLAKTMPDMKAVEHSGKVSVTRAEDLTDEQLADIAITGGAGVATQATGKEKPH